MMGSFCPSRLAVCSKRTSGGVVADDDYHAGLPDVMRWLKLWVVEH